jgi:hypothetical protein
MVATDIGFSEKPGRPHTKVVHQRWCTAIISPTLAPLASSGGKAMLGVFGEGPGEGVFAIPRRTRDSPASLQKGGKMAEPKYPTQEGLWSKGVRKEESFAGVKLGLPYEKAVENFRRAIEGRHDFDPAVLFVWGTMQAKAVLNVLKAAEEAFGEAGQAMVRKAINKAGYEAAEGLLKNSTFPEGLTDIELVSYIVTGVNCVLYASLEKPWITSETRSEFDILWCPHQDTYAAFDCRVQRYFVEGIVEAMEANGMGRVIPLVDKLIPKGAECCHFTVDRVQSDDTKNPWHRYSEELEKRALAKIKTEK